MNLIIATKEKFFDAVMESKIGDRIIVGGQIIDVTLEITSFAAMLCKKQDISDFDYAVSSVFYSLSGEYDNVSLMLNSEQDMSDIQDKINTINSCSDILPEKTSEKTPKKSRKEPADSVVPNPEILENITSGEEENKPSVQEKTEDKPKMSRKEKQNAALDLFSQGKTAPEVSKILGISAPTAYSYKKIYDEGEALKNGEPKIIKKEPQSKSEFKKGDNFNLELNTRENFITDCQKELNEDIKSSDVIRIYRFCFECEDVSDFRASLCSTGMSLYRDRAHNLFLKWHPILVNYPDFDYENIDIELTGAKKDNTTPKIPPIDGVEII